jgi:predicted component of type VI protein secretion system
MAKKAEMSLDLSFGTITGDRPEAGKTTRFRIALMGDFSGRAAKGEVEIGSDLAARRPIKLDVDTLDKVIHGFATTLVLPIGKKGQGIEVELGSIDDLHPDELFEKVEMFSELVALKRRLASGATAKGAVTELREWGKEFGKKVNPPARKSAGNSVPADRKLSDFAKLVGGNVTRKAKASPAEELMARIVGPYIQALPDPDAAAMQEAVEESLAGAMRLVLHHPEFQSVEAQWRMLDLITRSVETDAKLDIVLYDISAEELAADLSAQDDLTQSGFCELLVEGTPDGRGPFSAVCGLYTFEETPPHAELLGRIAKVCAHVNAPFFAAITPAFLDVAKDDRHPLVAQAWEALRAMPEAGHVGLVSPRFLLRRPYGAKSEPIYEFDFEEFTEQEGLSGMLWANPVALVVILLARSFRKTGPSLGLGQVMTLGGMPFHYVKDRYGDQVALPCTERNLTQTKTQNTIARGFMPVVSVKGRDEVRLASFQSLAGETVLGPWTDVPPPKPKEEPVRAAQSDDDDDAGQEQASEDAADTDDADLDALLAGFDVSTDSDDDTDDDASDEEMDADLAALLASL